MASIFERVTGAAAGLWDLGERVRLRVTGGDRIRFIDGMLTCAVDRLAVGSSAAGLLLDRKGHILALVEVLRLEAALWIEAEAGASLNVAESLRRFVIADDVEVEDPGDTWAELSVEGPGAAQALRAAASPFPDPGRVETGADGLLWLGGGALGQDGARALGPREAIDGLRRRLALPAIPGDQAEVLRIRAFRPRCGVDLGERSLPAEGPFADRISFTKGCYLGQEIVSRVQSRGGVHRQLVRLTAAAPVAAGARIELAGVPQGVVTSAATHPAIGTQVLGRLRSESPEAGVQVEIEGIPAEVAEVPRAFDPTR